MYRGTLNQVDITMGMAIGGAPSGEGGGVTGIFSTVTGIKRSESFMAGGTGAGGGGGGVGASFQRSFSQVKRRAVAPFNGGVGSTTQAFFSTNTNTNTNTNTYNGSGSTAGFDENSMSHSKAHTGGGGSLFAKVGQKSVTAKSR